MDSVTQAVLGATVAYSVLGHKIGPRAAIYGAVVGTLPDLDVFIDFGGAIENMTYHRGFTHSILVHVIAAPLLAWLFSRFDNKSEGFFYHWAVAIWLCLTTHALIDSVNVYGTQLLWPVTDHPFSFATLFFIDPVMTLPLVVAFVATLVMVRNPKKAYRVNAICLSISASYLYCSALLKLQVDTKVQQAMVRQGIYAPIYESSPAPFTTLLWRAVAVDDDEYYEIYASVFDSVDEVSFYRYQRNTHLLTALDDNPSVNRLRWFTKGQYMAWQQGDTINIADLRMGAHENYAFNFEVGLQSATGIEPGSFREFEIEPDLKVAGLLFSRIFDPTVSLAPDTNASLSETSEVW